MNPAEETAYRALADLVRGADKSKCTCPVLGVHPGECWWCRIFAQLAVCKEATAAAEDVKRSRTECYCNAITGKCSICREGERLQYLGWTAEEVKAAQAKGFHLDFSEDAPPLPTEIQAAVAAGFKVVSAFVKPGDPLIARPSPGKRVQLLGEEPPTVDVDPSPEGKAKAFGLALEASKRIREEPQGHVPTDDPLRENAWRSTVEARIEAIEKLSDERLQRLVGWLDGNTKRLEVVEGQAGTNIDRLESFEKRMDRNNLI